MWNARAANTRDKVIDFGWQDGKFSGGGGKVARLETENGMGCPKETKKGGGTGQ